MKEPKPILETYWACACTKGKGKTLAIKLNPNRVKKCKVCGCKKDGGEK